ncbi:MAG: aldose epimerase family protein [Aquirufa sp.]
MSNPGKPFGQTPAGESVTLYTLKNAKGMEVHIMNYGGIIQKILTPDRNGKLEDVVLGFETLQEYIKDTPYFGAVVGRFGNRIAKGKFTLDGKEYTLAAQNNGQHLHGGLIGFDKKVWKVEAASAQSLSLSYVSKDMEEGFPGNLSVKMTYTLSEDNELGISYEATTDKATVLNLSNHSYFNLSGNAKRDILNQEVQIDASRLVAVDKVLIPTGVLAPVAGTPFDFTKPHVVGDRINDTSSEQIVLGGGYDHCWALDKPAGSYAKIATVHDPVSGRKMNVSTDQPGVQFYTGNFLDGHLTGKYGVTYGKRFGLCLETEHFPDSPNQPNFPSTVLRPGEVYKTKTAYQFSVN